MNFVYSFEKKKSNLKIGVGLLLLCFVAFKFSTRTNSIFAIEQNHGIEIPKSTYNIEFQSYRWFVNICLDGNGSVVKCEMDKIDFENFIRKQKWCNHCNGIGEFEKYPDSLFGKYPITNEELQSNVADVLLFSANEIADDQLEVWFFTDCN